MADPPSQVDAEAADAPSPAPPPPGPLEEADGERQPITGQVERSPRALISAVWRQAQGEIEARLQKAKTDEEEQQSAALAIRLAMIASQVREKPREAERFLELAKEHPLTPRLTLIQAIEHGSVEELRTSQMLVDALVTDKSQRAEAMRDLAEAWLYRFGNAERAARAAQAGLDSVESTTSDTAAELRELFFLSLAVAGQWVDYVGFLGQAVATADIIPQHERLAMFIEALHASLDWLDRPENATKLVRRRFQMLGDPPDDPFVRAQYLHAVDLSLIAASVASDRDRVDRRGLLKRRLELAEGADDEAEVAVSRSWLAAELRQRRDWDGAAEQSHLLPEDGRWARRLRALEIVRDCGLAGRWDDVVGSLGKTADEAGELSSAYLRRAAEVSEAHKEESGATDLWHRIIDLRPDDVQAQRRLERRLLIDRSPALCDLLDQRADRNEKTGHVSRRRAVYFLRSDDEQHSRALARLEDLVGSGSPDDNFWSRMLLASLRRESGDAGGFVSALIELGKKAADALGQDGVAVGGALLSVAGFGALLAGDRETAVSSLQAALRRDARDLVSQLALAAMYRADEAWADLADALDSAAAIAVAVELRVDSLCELARVAVAHLDAPKRAVQALESALELSPDDPKVLRQMAILSDEDSEWEKSVELRVRALDADVEQRDSSSLLVEIGNIQEQRKYDDEEALVAYEQAIAADPRSLEATRGIARLLRKKGKHTELLGVLRKELELVKEPRDVAGTHLDIARTLRHLDEPPELALAAYREVLKIESENAVALDGLEEVARELGRFDVIVEAFRDAPSTQANLSVLAESLEQVGAWKEFADVRRREASSRGDLDERARLLVELAGIQEEEVRDLDAAISTHREILEFNAGYAPAQDALARLLEVQQSWPDLERAWIEEVDRLSNDESDKKLALHLRIGELRETQLSNLTGAVDSYKAALELNPLHVASLEALERVYKTTGQTYELAEVIGKRAEAAEDLRDRAVLYRRLAELLAPTAVDRAAEAWEQSFRADPNNREIFTGMEKFCYEHQLWSAAMALYKLAIGLVEDSTVRAFRLTDLYARRGHLELQFIDDPAAAASSYTKVVELEPDNDTALKYIESIYSQLQDWAKLISVYDRQATLARDPDRRVEAYRRAARIAATRLEDHEQAAKLYDLVLELDSADTEALDALEEFSTESKDWNKLVEVLRKRLESAPAGDAATGLLRRIAKICEEELRDEERAITYYQRILEIAPGHRGALEALGRIYESTERWADFVDVTRRQIKVTTDRAHKALLYFKCGSVMEAKFGEEDEAIRYYEAAIKTSPSCMPAVHGLRDMYRRREDWSKVVQTLELEVKLWDDDKERAGVFAQIGRVYGQHLGHRDRALHYYESALAVDPDCLPANQALFDEFFANREWERALPLANALGQKAMREGDPNARSDFYRKRGIVCRMTGDARAAAESIIVALEIRPESIQALDALTELVRESPEAYDFESTYRELERIYSKRDDAALMRARVQMGKAVLAEREGDLEEAERLLTDASDQAPRVPTVLIAVVNLHRRMRRWERAVDAIVKYLEVCGDELEVDVRAEALLLQADVHAEGQMDSHRAISVLREVIRIQPSLVEAHYRLAQELFALGRYAEAKASVEEVISLVAAPGEDVSPKLLARYYYYLGRILEASGEHRAAASQYRRAADYDPAYAQPILALAKRAAVGGDLAAAQTTLINAAHQAIEAAGKTAAVPMQRGLARLQIASGDPAGAIDAYRGMLAVNPDDVADRIALSELYVYQDLRKAIRELLRVVDRDIRVGPVYKQLAGYYARAGRPERTYRVHAIMEALGFADKQDIAQFSKTRSKQRSAPLIYPVDDELRRKLLVTKVASSPQGELLAAMEAELASVFPTPPLGENLQPVAGAGGGDKALRAVIAEAVTLFGVEPEMYVGEGVPGGFVVMSSPRPIVVLDRTMVDEGALALRFVLGYAFESIRGKYSLLMMLTARQQAELLALLKPLLKTTSTKAIKKSAFVASLTKRAHKLIDRVGESKDNTPPEEWIEGMLASARRAGLLMCDDFAAATRVIARLSGESLGRGEGVSAGLGAVICGDDLVRFYLSDSYNQLRHVLAEATEVGG